MVSLRQIAAGVLTLAGKYWRHPAVVIGALVVLFFVARFIMYPQSFLGGYDVIQAQYFYKTYTVERLKTLSLPLWNPHYYCGHPFLANPETNVFYPGTLIHLLLPLGAAFTLDALLHLILAGCGTYCFIRSHGNDRGPALWGATAYALSGFMIDRINAGHLWYVHAAALLPWILYAIEQGLQSDRAWWFVLGGGVSALLLLGGSPQPCYYVALAAGVYALLRLFAGRPSARRMARRIGGLVLVGAIALGLSAAQLLPSYEFAQESDRAAQSFDFATFLSFPPENVVTFLVPRSEMKGVDLYCEYSGYVGLLTVGFACYGFLFGRPRGAVAALSVVGVLAVFLMLGARTPVYSFLYQWLPGLGMFRIPGRAVILLPLVICVIASAGLQALRQHSDRMPRDMLMYSLLIAVPFLLFADGMLAAPASTYVVHLAVVGGLVWVLLCRRIALVLLIAILFFDLFLSLNAGIPLAEVGGVSMVEDEAQLTKQTPVERLVRGTHPQARFALPNGGARGMLHGYDDVDAYTPLAIARYFTFMHRMAGVPEDKLRRHQLNSQIFDSDHHFMGDFLNVKWTTKSTGEMVTMERTRPRAFLVKSAQVVPSIEKQLSQLKSDDFDITENVLVKEPLEFQTEGTNRTFPEDPEGDTVKIVRYEPESIEIQVNATADCYMFLSEVYYPGWNAYLDGVATEIALANYAFRAIAMPRGKHSVKIVYQPESLYWGLMLSWASLGTIVLCSIIASASRLRRGAALLTSLRLRSAFSDVRRSGSAYQRTYRFRPGTLRPRSAALPDARPQERRKRARSSIPSKRILVSLDRNVEAVRLAVAAGLAGDEAVVQARVDFEALRAEALAAGGISRRILRIEVKVGLLSACDASCS